MKCLTPGQGMMHGKQCGKAGDMGAKEGMRGGLCDRKEQEVLLGPDGGLFVVQGGRISKYDKDLDLVKTVEIDEGKDQPRGDHQTGMKKMCPMMKEMAQTGDADKPVPAAVKK